MQNKTAIKFKKSPINLIAAAWALLGFSITLIYSTYDWQATAGILMISQAFTGSFAWKRFKSMQEAIFPDFLSLIILYQFGIKTLTLLGIITRATEDHSNLVTSTLLILSTIEFKYQFQAELIFLVATLVFTLVWRLQEKKRSLALWTGPSSQIAWIAYGFCLLVSTLIALGAISSGFGLLQELLRVFSVAALAILLSGNTVYALGKPKSWMAIIALTPLLILALTSGMKSEVALTFTPILLPVILRLTIRRTAFIGMILLFSILFIYPFSEAWREANWNNENSIKKSSIANVTSNVTALWERDGVLTTAQISAAKWMSRSSSAEQGAVVMRLAEQDGLIGSILIEGLATIFVPRFLWPDKPTYAPGAWFTWYLGKADSPSTATSSTAMMLPTELYWMFGVIGVIIGMGLLSILYFRVWNYLLAGSNSGIVPILAMFYMLARSSGLEEIHTIYAISSPIILLAYVFIWNFFKKTFFRNKKLSH
jgi:hypothetical protein